MTRIKLIFTLFILGLCAPWADSSAIAACTGGSPTWSSTPDRASVASCVSSARDGDTINVSAGSAAWSTPIVISNKRLTIVGAGSGSTVISTRAFDLDHSGARISGFTFNLTAYVQIYGGSQNFRWDHNNFNGNGGEFTCVLSYGAGSGLHNAGLFDNNRFAGCQLESMGGDYGNSQNANVRWAEPNPIGTANAIYYEDNDFYIASPQAINYFNCFDAYQGGAYVVRFNTLRGCRFEAHGLQSFEDRGTRAYEIYNNTLTNTSTQNYRPWFMRGGSGMIFHNTSDGNFITNNIFIDNNRTGQNSIAGQVGAWGLCDGLSRVDQNVSGGEGYACLDQIGMIRDTSLWNYSTPRNIAQERFPLYVWKNTQNNNEIPVVLQCPECTAAQGTRQASKHVVLNRDYFTYSAGFNGTIGVGEGTLANRPSTCTTGVAYWATDQGEWNSRNAGPDGQLYKCVSPNTWAVGYIPLPYPHPLQNGASGGSGGGGGGVSGPTPSAPANLRITQ